MREVSTHVTGVNGYECLVGSISHGDVRNRKSGISLLALRISYVG